jgi:hypothetical protein
MKTKPPTAEALAARYTYVSPIYGEGMRIEGRGVFMRLGFQHFKIAEVETKADANWWRARIGEALARIVEENNFRP